MDSTIFHSAQSVVQLLDLSPRGTGHPPVSSPNNGLVLLQASGLHLFTVLGYKGDPSHDFVCIQVRYPHNHTDTCRKVCCKYVSPKLKFP